ncbi:MAG TPA: tagaturonate reductase [Bacillota bacterium]|nr:tagaturonate reductase [Bacillota bacterium]
MKNIKEVRKKTYGGLPEKVLQIGEGNFLRGFADWMIERTNSAGYFNGSVVLCQPIEAGMAEPINGQDGIYTVMMRGVENNQIVERIQEITSISRCINPYSDYQALVEIAKNPDLKVIISNTTEAGIAYRPGDKLTDQPPKSYPAKLTVLLYERFKKLKGQEDKGLLILPVELIERNGDNLKRYVLQYAEEWGLGAAFTNWLENANYFANTLVDRIVTGYPRDEIKEIREFLGYEDNILVTCEPFNLWVIEAPSKWSNVIPFKGDDVHVIWTTDMTPYRTRKVRILNGAHTVSVLAAYLGGHDIVLSMMKDKVFEQYLRKCIWNEVIPNIPLPQKEMNEFANAVFERFANPFIKHRLLDISLNSVSKYKARCLPSLLDYIDKYHKLPPILAFGLAALIAFYRGEIQNGKYVGVRGDGTYEIRDNPEILKFFAKAWQHPEDIVAKVLSNTDLWGQDLTKINGLSELVGEYLGSIIRDGAGPAVKNLVESL